jgi:branched-chain amino acid aminotransferase
MSGFDVAPLKVFIDGEIVAGPDAKISVFDHGLLYGDGIFEGLRLFSGSLFRVDDHLDRLTRSARSLKLELPMTREEIVGAIAATVTEAGLEDAHVRIVVTRGFGQPGLDPERCEQPTLIIMAYPFPPLLGDKPLRLLTTSIVRKAPRSVGAHIKSLNYLDSILAKQHARAAGADDAVMLDASGAVAECSSANLFAIDGDRLLTPTTRAALPGITRMTVIEAARDLGIEVVVGDIWPMELYAVDGIFVTGSGAGLASAREIDGRPLGTQDSELFAALRDAYYERTRRPEYSTRVSAASVT